MIGHVVTTTPAPADVQGLGDVARALARALARHGIAGTHGPRPEYLRHALNGYDWDGLDTIAVHTHGRAMHRPEMDCVRFRLPTPEVVRLRGLLAGLMDPRVRPDRHRTRWQRLVDRRTGRVTLRRVGVLQLHPADDVRGGFVAAFDQAVEQGLPAPEVVTTSGRLLRSELVEVTVPAGIAVRVVHRLRSRPVAGGAR